MVRLTDLNCFFTTDLPSVKNIRNKEIFALHPLTKYERRARS